MVNAPGQVLGSKNLIWPECPARLGCYIIKLATSFPNIAPEAAMMSLSVCQVHSQHAKQICKSSNV